ncbi:uncharacterized protein FRV6_10035 [Fusarium oxysporum]|uniref:C2H2-type domain-containing protein n=1 Tax=Fusarium oxysporum TaxID=5507 RepID=A0A2H3TAX7_FUSOX|nr:uncharacterized protein FRV6_10035 [Fusarium oxysporum]
MNTIADHVSACLQEFNSLCSSSTTWTDSTPDEAPQRDISLVKLQNELSRFKVWSGNIGAHKKGRSSLDHRLRDASNIRDQVVELLEDLRESLKDAKDIFTGQLTPWDQELSLAEFSDEDSDDEPFQVDASQPSELSQIFAAIVEDINCLLRLSVSIHNPSPHDRFKKACLTDTSGYEPFDVQHVCNKLSKAPKSIAERLGKAISRRRQYFKYRELHHDKLASGLELDDKDQMQSTGASSLPKKLNVNEPISLEEGGNDASDTGRSQTSWATSAASPERRKIPPLPVGAGNGPFECPFCFMMVSIASRNHWKKHVFSDLFPYICVELGCPAPDQDFQRRHQWAGHVKKYHRKTWTCKLGCDKTFDSSQDMKLHLAQKHSETTEWTHLDNLLTMCERPKPDNEPADCPLCNERQASFKQYQRHVGRHQEDLALFALPHIAGEEDEKNDDSDFESEGHEEVDSEGQDELERASSYVTRLSNDSGDEATDAAEHSPRYSRQGGFVIVDAIDERTDGLSLSQHNSRPWKCPVPSCQYHDYGWPSEEERDRHYSDKHSETSVMYECMFKPCPYKSKREKDCKQHMEKAHGWEYIRPQKADKKLPSISDMGLDKTNQQPGTPLDMDSPDESLDYRRDPDMMNRYVETENLDSAHADILYLNYKKFLYTIKSSRHAIRDGKLRVSTIREFAAGISYVPESLTHLVELSFKDTKLLIDGTPVRNYGISSGDTIKVASPRFRKSDQLSGLPGKDPWLDDGHGTEGNMGVEGKAERDKRRAEFSQELRQRAMVESGGDQVPVPKTESDLEIKDTRHASGPSQPPVEVGHKVVKSSTPGVRCATCALEGKEIWVVPGRCCGYCGTPCVDEDTLDVHDSFRVTGVNDNNEERLLSIPEGLEKKEARCQSLLVNGHCMDGADSHFAHNAAVISSSDRGYQYNGALIEVWPNDDQEGTQGLEGFVYADGRFGSGMASIYGEVVISDDGSTQKQEERP